MKYTLYELIYLNSNMDNTENIQIIKISRQL